MATRMACKGRWVIFSCILDAPFLAYPIRQVPDILFLALCYVSLYILGLVQGSTGCRKGTATTNVVGYSTVTP